MSRRWLAPDRRRGDPRGGHGRTGCRRQRHRPDHRQRRHRVRRHRTLVGRAARVGQQDRHATRPEQPAEVHVPGLPEPVGHRQPDAEPRAPGRPDLLDRVRDAEDRAGRAGLPADHAVLRRLQQRPRPGGLPVRQFRPVTRWHAQPADRLPHRQRVRQEQRTQRRQPARTRRRQRAGAGLRHEGTVQSGPHPDRQRRHDLRRPVRARGHRPEALRRPDQLLRPVQHQRGAGRRHRPGRHRAGLLPDADRHRGPWTGLRRGRDERAGTRLLAGDRAAWPVQGQRVPAAAGPERDRPGDGLAAGRVQLGAAHPDPPPVRSRSDQLPDRVGAGARDGRHRARVARGVLVAAGAQRGRQLLDPVRLLGDAGSDQHDTAVGHQRPERRAGVHHDPHRQRGRPGPPGTRPGPGHPWCTRRSRSPG